MKRTLITAIVAAAALVLAACSPNGGSAAGGNSGSGDLSSLDMGTFLDMTTWDPAKADIGFEVTYLSAVYDSLVALDENSEPIPSLATDWSYSKDYLTLTMQLREGITFTDGEKFDARAAVANLKHLNDGIRSQQAYRNVKSIEATGDYSIEIHLSEKDDALLYFMGLGRSWMVSPAALKSGELDKEPVGSGPYTFNAQASTPGSEYHFVKKDDYWNDELFPFDEVTMHPINDPTASLNAMLSGQLDVIYAMPQNIPQAEEHGWNIYKGVASWVGIQFADRKGEQLEPLADKKVRQALNYAFQTGPMLESAGPGAGTQTNQVFSVDGPVHSEELDSRYAYNLDKAKELLAEAGYADGFEVSMPMSTIYQPWQAATEQTLSKLGITVKWEDLSPADYQTNASTYPMFLAVIALDSNPIATVQRQIASSQWYNPEPVTELSPEIAELTQKAKKATGDEQLATLKKLNEAIAEAAPWSLWYQSNNVYFAVEGVEVTPITGMMFPQLRYIQKG